MRLASFPLFLFSFILIFYCTSVHSQLCGNTVLNLFEECDDGNRINGDGCSYYCQEEIGWNCEYDDISVCTSICGDSRVVGKEQCDDGNLINDDGCNNTCQYTDPSWNCTGQPSICVKYEQEQINGADNTKGKKKMTAVALGICIPLLLLASILVVLLYIKYKKPEVWEDGKSRMSNISKNRSSQPSSEAGGIKTTDVDLESRESDNRGITKSPSVQPLVTSQDALLSNTDGSSFNSSQDVQQGTAPKIAPKRPPKNSPTPNNTNTNNIPLTSSYDNTSISKSTPIVPLATSLSSSSVSSSTSLSTSQQSHQPLSTSSPPPKPNRPINQKPNHIPPSPNNNTTRLAMSPVPRSPQTSQDDSVPRVSFGDSTPTNESPKSQPKSNAGLSMRGGVPEVADYNVSVTKGYGKTIFGTHLAYVKRGQTGIPEIVEELISFLEKNSLYEEGILRLAGSTTAIKQLKEAYEKGDKVNLLAFDINAVAGVLKLWFRELPKIPLLTTIGIKAAGECEDENEKAEILNHEMKQIPEVHYLTLKRLFGYLNKVAANAQTNKMQPPNLAIVWYPTLQIRMELLITLVTRYEQVFDH